MDFSLTEDQTLFRDTIGRVVADLFPFERRQAAVASAEGFRAEDWSQLAELGCMAAAFPEDCGGLDGGPEALMLVAESMGRHLVNLPFFASVVLGGHAVLFGTRDDRRQAILPAVADGSVRLALAVAERQSGFDLADVATRALADGDGWVIAGRKDMVLYGQAADTLIVSARTAGDRNDRDGIGLFAVPASGPGVTLSGFALHDGGRAANIRFDNVRVADHALLGEADAGLPVLERVRDHGIAFLCADAVGSMWQVHETTLEYLKTRQQFGQTLGSFQALQHRMVDVYMSCELAQSMVLEATLNLDKDAATRSHAASAAKVAVGEAVRKVAEEGVQLHGGIGMTFDMPLGHHLKRAMVMNATLGDVRHHLEACAGRARSGQAEERSCPIS
ncbi:MAG: acyl-CoA dehydrogenase family protein [Rhodospirillales bacterium]|nr:acyl-CoA dehydrogenase family protein [Rhodospirillales bacterium]